MIDAQATEVVSAPGDGMESVGAQRLSGVGLEANDGEFLIVAGLELRERQMFAVPWPLSTPLRTFFAASSWPGGSGPPDHVEREAFERMGEVFSAKKREDVRFAAPTGDAAERLIELFSSAPEGPHGDAPTLVTRDRFNDQYLVVLGSASCERALSHHGGPCPDSPDEHSGVP